MVGLVVTLVSSDPGPLEALLGGLRPAAGVFLAWALGRELDPDRAATARYAVFVYALLVWLGPPSVLAPAALLVAGRIVLRPTGLTLTASDLLGAAVLGVLASWTGTVGVTAGLAIAAAMALDYTLEGSTPPGLQALAVPVTIMGVVLTTAAARSFLGGWRAPTLAELGVLAAALVATSQLGVSDVRTTADRTGEPLLAARLLRARQVVVAAVVGTVLWSGSGAVAALAPALAAIIALGVGALTAGRWRGLGRLGTGLLAVTALVLAGCAPGPTQVASPTRDATQDATGDATQDATGDATDTTPAAPDPAALPSDPRRLAAVLTRAERLARRPGLPLERLRPWAHVQQAAYRLLSRRPALRGPTRSQLPGGLRGAFDRNLRATVELHRLTEPQDELPSWHIVTPPDQARLRDAYQQAAEATGIHWSYLAAIHLVETRMGRIRGESSAGARGPMQFLPSTWEAYGEGDITDPHDAVHAAARYLADHGAPGDMRAALFAYNRSERYVQAIIDHAAVMRRHPATYRAYHQWQVYYRLKSGEVLLEEGWSHRDEG